ncbi:MAG: DUF3955 domain-containing protein [Bacillota bacterium]|uniref:DUF3955 domain-containing protein n=1 Tax=Virgibacillus salarius TaxID=447199 RepID=A0A941DXW2_9BACI|nr:MULTISPECIES: DUF3955 domain-containing protein [Bacillaceae]NAZ10138.1 DUF3955 domain-containing protein [Agaribacter marinus]MBR7797426.1 DUF3955 domain-containing protein [Virgibacillus salarius]MCC2250962.1 DUF3955 domain-containing protein [Virgibacillus sp. AGTR]MDY7044463.1 DUF3955 domain-containing protein [Virgibacillus sp. M23]QRZ19715.1 DUF3955 domain-containing protein [Virgibacillus sp. AGTR]
MKKKYLLASTPILLGAICFVIYSLIGSSVEPDGTLIEPFFLINLSYLFVFSGVLTIFLISIVSFIKRISN